MSVIQNDLGETIQEGYPGNLTPEHAAALREFWRRFFEVTERNAARSDELRARGGYAAAQTGHELSQNTMSKDKKKESDEAKKAGELKSVEDALSKYGGPYLREAFWSMTQTDAPDATMLRFLRARKFDIDRALGMMVAALQFRMDMDLDEILRKGEEGLQDEPGFMNQYRRGISYIEGSTSRERHELPIYFIHVARHFTNAQKIETLQRFVLLAMENARSLTTPPLMKAVIVFDMAGFGLKNMDWQCVLFILKCLEAYYPESLQRVYVHGAPWIFKGIWTVLQPLIDPDVQAKIRFSTKAKELEEYVPASRLRTGMGGTLDWDWAYTEPVPGENEILNDTETRDAIQHEWDELIEQFEQSTRAWIATDGDRSELDYRREVLSQQLRLKYFQLRPYLRAVSIYQRAKVLRNDGLITWSYPQTTGSTETQHVNDRHSVPQLVRWLRERNEDTLESSVGGQRSPACVCGESYDVGDALKLPKKTQKAVKVPRAESYDEIDKAAAAAIAAAAKRSRTPAADDAEARAASARPASEPARRRATDEETPVRRPGKPRRKPVPSWQPESKAAPPTEAAQPGVGAVAGGAGAARGMPSLSSKPSVSSLQSASSFASANEHIEPPADARAYSVADLAAAAPVAEDLGGLAASDLSDDDDDDGIVEEERHALPSGHASDAARREAMAADFELDDEEQSEISADVDDEDDDLGYTPETVLAPTYTQAKVSAAACRQSEAELREDLDVAHEAMQLFLNSQMHEAEQLCEAGADRRLYRSVGMTLINCVKSLMTYEPSDLQIAMKCCKHTMAIADVLRRKPGRLARLLPTASAPALQARTLQEQHAELVYAEAMLLRAVLGIVYAGGTVGFVRHAMTLRNAYAIVRDLLRGLEEADAAVEEASIQGRTSVKPVDQDLRSGIYLSNGLCQLILSLLPKRLLGLMEKVGFTGDRRQALQLFMRAGGWSPHRRLPGISAEMEGVRRPLCDMMLLLYHLVIAAYVPVTDVDLTLADQVLSWNLQRFPRGIFFLYFSARLYATQALPEKAIECYRSAIEAQRAFKQLHHLCFWSLSLTYLTTCDYDRAYECYDVLARESNWSKAIYQYAKAAMLYESSTHSHAQSSAIMRTVPGLVQRVAGRHLPFERFVRLKAAKFAALTQLGLPALEFSYLWHCLEQAPVFLLTSQQLTRIDTVIDELEAYDSPSAFGAGDRDFYALYCLAFFLRGVALRYVAYPEPQTLVRHPPGEPIVAAEVADDALHSFLKVFEYGHFLDAVDRYLVYYAHYELGCLYSAQGNEADARREFELVLSRKPLVPQESKRFRSSGKADYLLSGMCQLRAHAALETMRINRDRRAQRSSTSRSLRRRSTAARRATAPADAPAGTHAGRARQSRLIP
ncbi:hypothetical protein MBRA1_003652 [Malassezia brasiliensis]|uniref:CRAL-TRIO domain-containing protein n=1 Tax=Malassezia brasiliensis TaxID=1821822 RepID=A0AAF0DXY5_9BASI|nr:hypothetical protein MBRA1_003652 [Malassezia brasiliensis]